MWAVGDDGFYFLTDRGVIKHYDHSGSFVAEYDKHGRGPGEFLMAYAMRLDDCSKMMTVLDPRGNLYHYSTMDSLEFVSQEVIPDVVAVHNICQFGKDWLLYSCSDREVFRIWNGNSVSEVRYRHKGGIKYSFNASEPFIVNAGDLYYYEGFSGDIFALDEDEPEMEMRYWWDFGKYTSKAYTEDFRKTEFSQYLKEKSYSEVFPFLHMLKSGSILYADVLFCNEEHSLFYDIDTGESLFFRSFKEGYRFKASKVWNGCLYLVVESEYLEEFGVEDPVNSNTCIIKYTLKQ